MSFLPGALTIDGDLATRNLAYYVIAHASQFVLRPGSVRIASTAPGDRTVTLGEDEQRPKVYRAQITEHADVAPNAAFRTPDGKIVLIVANDSWSRRSISVQQVQRPVCRVEPHRRHGDLRMGRIASIVCCLSLAAGSVRTQAQDTVRHPERTRNTFSTEGWWKPAGPKFSPEVHDDRTITFRLRAPQAERVSAFSTNGMSFRRRCSAIRVEYGA